MANETCVKHPMENQSYKVVSTHYHEISGWKILSRLLHSSSPNIGGMNGDVQSDLATLTFNNGEQLEYFHSRIFGIQQEMNPSGENVSPTLIIFQYTKEF